MATVNSRSPRIVERRDRTVEAALDHAQAIMTEGGAGAVTVSEIARRLGMRAPSLYKYFPSLHAIYDSLFSRGNARVAHYITEATATSEPGLDHLLTASRAMIRWSIQEPGLASLLYTRPVPGFEPSGEAFAPAQAMWRHWRNNLTIAAQRGQLTPSADSDDAMRMLTVLISGICSQQLANQPGAAYEDGIFTRLTDEALDMFIHRYTHERQRS
jgi:AcrR family transcriptional regulator